MDLVSTERDLLTQYTTTFSQQQTDIVSKYQVVSDRLASSIQAENEQTTTLAQLQKQWDGLTLSATVDNFTQIKADLAAKYQAYTDIVQSNNAAAAALFAKLQDSKEVVSQISALIKDIDSTITSINSAIDTYSIASAASTGSASLAQPALTTDVPVPVPVADAPAPDASS